MLQSLWNWFKKKLEPERRKPQRVELQDWPPLEFGDTFGYATKATPRPSVQDPALVQGVEAALANGKKCEKCGCTVDHDPFPEAIKVYKNP